MSSAASRVRSSRRLLQGASGARILALALFLTFVAVSSTAHADWDDGRMPEGDNAFTLHRHRVRLSLLGRSAIGLSDHVELSSYLPLDLVLFPNLMLKIGLYDSSRTALALKLSAGGGLYPVIGGVPLPPFAALGFVGILAGSYQLGQMAFSVQPLSHLTLTARAGVLGLEIGTVTVVGVVGGGAADAFPILTGGSTVGADGGGEIDAVLGPHNALTADATFFYLRSDRRALMLATLAWTHAWRGPHLSVGAFTFTDVPHATLWQGHPPIGPYLNFYWTF